MDLLTPPPAAAEVASDYARRHAPAALPRPRGPLSEMLFGCLLGEPQPVPAPVLADDPLVGDDFHLALYCCYELHYRSFAGVADGWEWEPSLLAYRAVLETAFEAAVRAGVEGRGPSDVHDALVAVANTPGPSVSAHLASRGTLTQYREFVVHRSPYQLKEADPHTWAIPRLAGGAKAAMVGLQVDEYGNGDEAMMHATLFADTMEEMGLDAAYGAYLDLVPGTTLAGTNLISMFGLHRRLRGALVGHLALFEMTSVTPMGRYRAGLERLGFGERAQRFYEVHVVADQLHSVTACQEMAVGLARDEPALAADIVLGGRAASMIENRFAQHLLASWQAGRSSLRGPAPW